MHGNTKIKFRNVFIYIDLCNTELIIQNFMSLTKAVKTEKHPFYDSRCLLVMSDYFGVE